MSADPLEGLSHVLDRNGMHWERITDVTWRSPHGAQRVGSSLLSAGRSGCGPLTPLVPGEPIHPEPAEPTGLGAVVRDVNGACWVHNARRGWNSDGDWRCQYGDWSRWADIPRPLMVLSEGYHDPEQVSSCDDRGPRVGDDVQRCLQPAGHRGFHANGGVTW